MCNNNKIKINAGILMQLSSMRVKREKLLKFQLADKVNGYWFTFSNKNLSEINLSVYSNAQF